ncbi:MULTISPECIES: hypothetical protein [unclassified Streptomyces]|uniref:hypothetical protein n=1 Tax=unclassified Streptomyces TaxID=2593676 RepID=UPI00381802C4
MTTTAVVVLFGCLIGAGLALVVRELAPAPPKLGPALKRLSPPAPTPGASLPEQRADNLVGAWLVARVPAPLPRADLQLLNQPVEQFLLNKVLLAFVGLVLPSVLSAAWTLLDITLPLFVPAVAGVLAAVLLWFVPDLMVRRDAARAREEFTHAITVYLELVALRLASNIAVDQALEEAARVGSSWSFLRLQEALLRARMEKSSPWQVLEDLGTQLKIPVLRDVADFAQMSGKDGASIYAPVRARAKSTRDEQLSTAVARANSDSEKMHIPGAVMCVLIMCLLSFPVVLKLFALS